MNKHVVLELLKGNLFTFQKKKNQKSLQTYKERLNIKFLSSLIFYNLFYKIRIIIIIIVI